MRKENPRFHITIEKNKNRAPLERTPRYDVRVNGEWFSELYFNMTGYNGYLPTVHGDHFSVGERGISVYRKAVADLNREARIVLETAADCREHVLAAYDTEDVDTLMLAVGGSGIAGRGGAVETRYSSRSDYEYACLLFNTAQVPISYLREKDMVMLEPQAGTPVNIREGDKVLQILPTASHGLKLLAIGKPDESMHGRPMRTLDPEAIAAATNSFAWVTTKACQALGRRAGRALIDAANLPLNAGKTLPRALQPDMLEMDRNRYPLIVERLRLFQEPESDLLPSFS